MLLIYRGKLQVPVQKESIDWFCQEMLVVIDTPALFTASFTQLLLEKKWQHDYLRRNGIGESSTELCDEVDVSSEMWRNESLTAQRNPGILIPIFMGDWICNLSKEEDSMKDHTLLDRFLRKLLQRISLCNSSQAVKWILRCFSFPIVQASLMNENTGKGLFKMSVECLQFIRTLVKVLSLSNVAPILMG